MSRCCVALRPPLGTPREEPPRTAPRGAADGRKGLRVAAGTRGALSGGRFRKYLQGGGLHCPGQSVPKLDHSLHEKILPNILFEPPVGQLEALLWVLSLATWEKEINILLAANSFQ